MLFVSLSPASSRVVWNDTQTECKANERKPSALHSSSAERTLLTSVASCIEQEEYIKEEQRSLKRELLRAQEEVKRIQSVPLVIGQFLEMVDGNSGIVGSTTGRIMPEPLEC